MYEDILNKICNKYEIKFIKISNNSYKLVYKGIVRYIDGYKFDLNRQGISMIMDNKSSMSDLLSLNNIENTVHKIIINQGEMEIVHDYFNKYKKIIIKDIYGTCGRNVFLIEDVQELERVANIFLKDNLWFTISPYYSIDHEYRVIMYEHDDLLIYSKKRPIVYGDGMKTTRELLLDYNFPFFNKINLDNLNKVLDKGEEYIYEWRHNLSLGATISLDINKREELKMMAYDVMNSTGLRFASVDIIEVEGKLMVLEVNSGVMMTNLINILEDGISIATKVYERAIKGMFNI